MILKAVFFHSTRCVLAHDGGRRVLLEIDALFGFQRPAHREIAPESIDVPSCHPRMKQRARAFRDRSHQQGERTESAYHSMYRVVRL